MREPPRILIVDDTPANLHMLQVRLAANGYDIVSAADGEAALAAVKDTQPDLILLDVMMPKMDGFEVCRRLRADPAVPFIPVIMVTANTDPRAIVAGLEAGGDEYLISPVDQAALVARVKSMLRIKTLHDTVEALAANLADWNRTLEQRVQDQVAQLDHLGQLKRFFSPQLAELIVARGAEDPLKTHRREVTVVFLDLRGFTAFSDSAEPEEVMGVLREYHNAMGEIIVAREGTHEHFAGDGMMVVFNDPVVVPDPAQRAVRMAVEMQRRYASLFDQWKKFGYDIGLGIGIAHGYATIGAIGYEGRLAYGTIGSVANLAARLCGDAKAGQILASQHVVALTEGAVTFKSVGELTLKGFVRPIAAFEVLELTQGTR